MPQGPHQLLWYRLQVGGKEHERDLHVMRGGRGGKTLEDARDAHRLVDNRAPTKIAPQQNGHET